MTYSRETFHFTPPVQIKVNWMTGLMSLEVYNSIFNINTTNNKFELYKFPDEKIGGVSYEKVGDEIERDLDISNITATNLQDETIGPIFIEEYREQVTKRMEDSVYMNRLAGYPSSLFQDFESSLATVFDSVEVDIRLVLDKNISSFISDELTPDLYSFKKLSEAL